MTYIVILMSFQTIYSINYAFILLISTTLMRPIRPQRYRLELYIYIYVYMYICIYVYMYICIYVYTYIRIYVRTYVYTYVHTYIRTYVHTYIICTYIHMYICTYVHQARSWGGAWGAVPPHPEIKLKLCPPPGLTVGLENLTDFH